MKKCLPVVLLFFSLSAFAGEIQVKVSGMVCSLCAQGIQKKFSAQKGVKELKVDMDQKLVTILTKEGEDIQAETIKRLIAEAGYNVAGIERK